MTLHSPATARRLAQRIISSSSNASIIHKAPTITSISQRPFSSSAPKKAPKNRIYPAVRRPEEFQTYLSLSTSTHTPLLTFWTTSYCSTCRVVSPILHDLLLEQGVGEAEGGVAYCEIEYDSADIMSSDLATTYAITSVPTLLAFHKGFAAMEDKVARKEVFGSKERLEEWIRETARARDTGGDGTGLFGRLFGGGGR